MLEMDGYREDIVEITSSLVQLETGEKMFLLSIPGSSYGMAISCADIDSGAITPMCAYEMMCEQWIKDHP